MLQLQHCTLTWICSQLSNVQKWLFRPSGGQWQYLANPSPTLSSMATGRPYGLCIFFDQLAHHHSLLPPLTITTRSQARSFEPSSLLWTKLAPLNHAHFFCTIMLLHWASCQREPNVSDILLSLLTWTTHFGALISNKPHSDPQQLIYWLFLSWILIAPIAVIH